MLVINMTSFVQSSAITGKDDQIVELGGAHDRQGCSHGQPPIRATFLYMHWVVNLNLVIMSHV